jgi:ATP-dependent RNA helicase DeaD
MSELTELGLSPAVAGLLESWGYGAGQALLRDAVPAACRGTNLVLSVPPAARYAVPALAGLVTALAAGSRLGLVLVPGHALDEWTAILAPLARVAGLPLAAARRPGRAGRQLREGALRVLVTTPEVALALVQRSSLKLEAVGSVVLGWPDGCDADATLTALMQDLPAETQRIVVPADPRAGATYLERYARRALLSGPLEGPQPAPAPQLRVCTTDWARRATTIAQIIEAEDPASCTVWCADADSAAQLARELPALAAGIQVGNTGPLSGQVIAWDLPTPEQLHTLRAGCEVTLLVAAHAASYLHRLVERPIPLRTTPALAATEERLAGRRAAIRQALDAGELEGELLALAPLFQQYDAAEVAAGLYRLWMARPTEAPAPVAAAGHQPVARIWVGLGKKDGAGPSDLVAVLTKEVGLDGRKIGRIEIKETFMLVEVPGDEAEDIARRLTGRTVRRRQLVARVDVGGKGTGPAAGRPARSSASARSRRP